VDVWHRTLRDAHMILQKNSTEKHVKINNQVKSCFLLFFAQPKTGKCYCINSTQNTAYKSEMPPPGPSQKGKFKPRKPVKKARAGVPDAAGSNASSNNPTAESGSGAATAAQVAAANDRKRNSATVLSAYDTTGRGSGGRGGRGGRGGGRGRGPQPQGQAFFTAAPVGSAAKGSKGSGSSSSRGTTIRGSSKAASISQTKLVKKKEADDGEEIVGEMEKGIGSNFDEENRSRNASTRMEDEDYIAEPATSTNYDTDGPSRKLLPDECMYDSDSSAEGTKPKPNSNLVLPSRLPFPVAPLPVGIGAHDEKRPTMYLSQETSSTQDAIMIELEEATAAASNKHCPSPFVDPNDSEALRQELESFFLVQLPTRLPDLVQKTAASPATAIMERNSDTTANFAANAQQQESKINDSTLPSQQQPIADVVTAPVDTRCFDNTMRNASPGRLGKLVVYKSGKTVLVLQGPPNEDGSPSAEVRMMYPCWKRNIIILFLRILFTCEIKT